MTKEDTQFSQEQLAAIAQIVQKSATKSNESVSVYDQRDNKAIETVNVKKFDGEYVIAYKDLNKDPASKKQKYTEVELDIFTKKNTEYITLILSDGKNEREMKVRLSDLMAERHNRYQAKVLNIEVKKIIDQHGLLGKTGMANDIDGSGKVISGPAVKAESLREERVFIVEIPGFAAPVRLEEYVLA